MHLPAYLTLPAAYYVMIMMVTMPIVAMDLFNRLVIKD